MRLAPTIAAAFWFIAGGGAAQAQNGPTIEEFATRPVMTNVALSPDGEHLAYRLAQARTGDYYIEVRDVDDLTGDPVRLGSARMDISGYRWISDDTLWVDFIQQVSDRVDGQNQGTFRGKQAIFNISGRGRPVELYDDMSLISSLGDDPDHVLVETARVDNDLTFEELQSSGRALSDAQNADIFRMDARNARLDMVLAGNSSLGGYYAYDGEIRIAQGFEEQSREQVYYHNAPGGEIEFEAVYRIDIDNVETSFSPLGFDPENEFIIFVSANRGENYESVWEFDLRSGEFGEKVFSYDMLDGVPPQDITSAARSNAPGSLGAVTGFRYYDDEGRPRTAYIDADEQALMAQLEATFPGEEVRISSRSRDETRMVIFTRSATNPGTYYLLADGELSLIGSRRPHLDPDALRPNQYIEYTARDGRTIPAYLTLPEGEGPFPLIVMPHGGPWVEWRPTAFDEWTQLLATNGYAVLDPLFRGTQGLGNDHWTSSFGEWGKAMSDDMDDGALFLVDQGVADPERLAMFGWSFGGYSAFAASIREPQIYQCTIAGAGVGDPVEFRAFFTRNRFGRELLTEGYAGLNTVARTDDVSVPILVVHGELDQRVRLYHSEQFVAGLERANKPHRFVVLDDADHFDNTLDYDHRTELYDEMLSFLRNDCGPGGL